MSGTPEGTTRLFENAPACRRALCGFRGRAQIAAGERERDLPLASVRLQPAEPASPASRMPSDLGRPPGSRARRARLRRRPEEDLPRWRSFSTCLMGVSPPGGIACMFERHTSTQHCMLDATKKGSPDMPATLQSRDRLTGDSYCRTANTHTPEPACGQCESTSSSLATVEIQLCASVRVTNATYCRPFAMKVIGLPESFVSMRGDFQRTFPVLASKAIM